MQVDPKLFQAVVIAQSLRTYAKTGMKMNRAYTPKNMMLTAEKITGQKFKARDYVGAADALKAYADRRNAELDGKGVTD